MTQQDILKPLIASLAVLAAIGCGDAVPAGSAESSTLNYAAWAYDGEGLTLVDDELPGMILMRDVSNMTSIAESYYDDGLGNLLFHGSFESSATANEAGYALTFMKGGGVQLAIDFESDRIVDAVFDITPEGHFGVIGNLLLESDIDCIARRMIDGEDPLSAVDACLGSPLDRSNAAGGSGLAGPTGSEYERLAEPDCGATTSPGFLSMVASAPDEEWQADGSSAPFESNGYKVHVTYATRPSEVAGVAPDRMETVRAHNSETGDYYVVRQTTEYHSEGSTVTIEKITGVHLPNGVLKVTGSYTVDGVQQDTVTAEFDAETGECLKGDCAMFTVAENSVPEADTSGDGNGDAAAQPGPNCELEGDCPFSDPRCAGPNNDMEALWDCVARTNGSPMDCLARLNDAVYATTGCMTVLGPSGQPELQCPGSDADQVADCLSTGAAIDGCLGDAGGGTGENDDLLDTFSGIGSSDISYLDYTGIGGVLLGFCDEGVEQLCGGRPAY
jgi:hypothetical protein